MASAQPPRDEIDDDAAIDAAAAEDAFGLANLGQSSETAESSSTARKIAAMPATATKRTTVANPEVLTEVGRNLLFRYSDILTAMNRISRELRLHS